MNTLSPNPYLDPAGEREDAYYRKIAEHFSRYNPHGADLKLAVHDVAYGSAILKMPYQDCLLGDKDRGLLHNGVIISLIDSSSGMASFCALPDMAAVATLDLRVDNMRPAVKDKDIYCMAECYRLTPQIAFVRATAYQEEGVPLASSSSSFMRATAGSFLDTV